MKIQVSADGLKHYRIPIKDRVQCWYHNWRNRHVAKAVRVLSQALRDDPSFRETWHANIAMQVYDASRPRCWCKIMSMPADENGHVPNCNLNNYPENWVRDIPASQTNDIADKLMKHLFGI